MNADIHRYLINEPEKSFSSVFACARKSICGEVLRLPVKNGRAPLLNGFPGFHGKSLNSTYGGKYRVKVQPDFFYIFANQLIFSLLRGNFCSSHGLANEIDSS